MGQKCQKVASFSCKAFLMLFNIYLWISGVFLFAIGILIHFELKKFMDLSEDASIAAPLIFIGTGFAISVVAIVACYCTVKNHSGLLYTYALFIAISYTIQLTACILAYTYRDQLKEELYRGLNNTLTNYNIDYERTSAFDKLQTNLHCCGVDSYEDYSKSSYGKVPLSCCKEMSCDSKNLEMIYKKGCYTVMIDLVNDQLTFLLTFVIGLSIIHVLGIIIAVILARIKIKCVKYDESEDRDVAERLLKSENEEYEKEH